MSWNSRHRCRKQFIIAGLLTVVANLSLSNPVFPQAQKTAGARSPLANPAIEKRVDALLKQMTIEEKVGQLTQYSSGAPTGPSTGNADYPDMIARGEVGSLF